MNRSYTWIPSRVEPIGIDLGARLVRMVQLARSEGRPTVIACAERLLPPGPHTPAEHEQLCFQAIAEMLAEGSFIGRSAVTIVPWSDLQIRTIRVPQGPAEETTARASKEACGRFGMDPVRTEIRCAVAGDVRDGTEIVQELLVYAVSRDALRRQVDRLVAMGLQPAALDAGPCAIFRPFERFLRRDEDRSTVHTFVDFGYLSTRILVTRGADPIHFRSVPVGGRTFDTSVSDALELLEAEACDLRMRLHRNQVAVLTGATPESDESVGESTRRAVIDAIRGPIEQLAREIAASVRYCCETFRILRCAQVTTVGGEACNGDILRMLSDQLNVPFRIGRPMREVACRSEFEGSDRRTGQPEWTTAIGLALKPVKSCAEVAA